MSLLLVVLAVLGRPSPAAAAASVTRVSTSRELALALSDPGAREIQVEGTVALLDDVAAAINRDLLLTASGACASLDLGKGIISVG